MVRMAMMPKSCHKTSLHLYKKNIYMYIFNHIIFTTLLFPKHPKQ